eukprot:353830-Chlamydomonas_euryale.AAC.14
MDAVVAVALDAAAPIAAGAAGTSSLLFVLARLSLLLQPLNRPDAVTAAIPLLPTVACKLAHHSCGHACTIHAGQEAPMADGLCSSASGRRGGCVHHAGSVQHNILRWGAAVQWR